jgi:hypothetical protein
MSGGSPAGLRHPIGDPIPFLDRYRVQAKAAARLRGLGSAAPATRKGERALAAPSKRRSHDRAQY